jgi:hypothetical protein
MPLPGTTEPGSTDLHRIVLESLQANGIGEQLRKVIRDAYGAAMAQQGIIVHHAESERLFARVMRSVLEGMLRRV